MKRCRYNLFDVVLIPNIDGIKELVKINNCIFDNNNSDAIIPCMCDYYIPVEIDPYWKDIIEETNRRLYDR